MALQVFILLIAVLLCSAPADSNHNLISSRCPEAERQALTDLKDAASDPANRLSSWSGTDCCQWDGVHCDNQTGHVIGVDLRNLHVYHDYDGVIGNSSWALQIGKLPSSLLALNYLSYLDLSANYFKETAIPQFIGSFRELRYLNLSFTNLNGTIPSQLGRLSNLHTLSLQVDMNEYWEDSEDFQTTTSLVLDSPRWLSGLRSLHYFEISNTRLAAGWLQSLNMLPSLRQISVSESSIDNDTLSLPHVNFTSLETLILRLNLGLTSALFSWLPNLTHLQYLDLSDNYIEGSLPSEIWSMSTLEVLILFDNDIATIPEVAGNLHRLQRLELSGNSISGVIPASIGNLTQLRELYLDRNNLSGQIPASIGNLNQLQLLDFSYNALSGSLPVNVTNLSSLKHLQLSRNSLNGPIPHSLGRLSRLEKLDLSANALTGTVPESLGQLSQLVNLDLSSNMLTGTIPESLGQLSQLVNLDLSNNSLSGIVTKSHFASLLNLKVLWMSDNSMLAINLSSGWRLPFDLNELGLRGCRVGPKFPSWIRTQRNMTNLDLSSTMISDSIPDWFWGRRSFVDLNLSHNEIHGKIPSSFQGPAATIDLHSNLLDGPLPNDFGDVDWLDLSDNRFSGTIPREMVKNAQGLDTLWLSNNNLTGPIPSSLCDAYIINLDLSGNLITGQLPNCTLSKNLLDLSNNHLTGNIPDAFLNSSSLTFLFLSNNNFTGEVPSTLAHSKNLVILDLGNNKFRGGVPIWLDDSFQYLRVLRLSSNMLTGFLPVKTLSRVPNLQILDLSHNYLSGTIPESFGNFTTMMRHNYEDYDDIWLSNGSIAYDLYGKSVSLDIKGRNSEYASLLMFLTDIDLSNNNLSGAIPKELGNLTWLHSLNVSCNHLTGEITKFIGGMERLESLDLSRNEFSGLLPQSLANLSSLGFLNVSYNNFSGRIPSGGHLDTFDDPSIYMGNPYLYRDRPADKNQTNQIGQRENEAVDDNEDEIIWLYIGLAPGFVVGFWALFGVLVFKKTWRHAYFRAIDDVYDLIYVKVVVHHRKFKRFLQSRK